MQEADGAPDPDATALAERLRHAVSTFVRAIRRGTETRRSAQDEMLDLLARDGAMNVAALAQARNVKHQTMRLVAAQLEAASLARGAPDPSDRRSRLFTISDAGRAELERGRQARAAQIAELIRTTLSDEEREILGVCVAVLERLSASAGG